jgi:aldehyde dehydrogenase (NAD+)
MVVYLVFKLIFRFKTIEEVLERANATPYGLAAGIWTSTLSKAERMARGLRVGTLWVNCYNWTPYNTPFGGMKESGFGRDLGDAALQEYTVIKAITYRI